MKIILFIALLIFGFSCSDMSADVTELNDINVESLEQFVPINYLESSSRVIFSNSDGENLVFNIVSTTTIETSRINDLEYQRELKSFSLRNDDLDYSLNILMSAHYYDQNTVIKSIDCSLFTDANGGWIPTIRLDNSGNIRVGERGDITLGQKTFSDVFSNIESAENEFKFSKIYYNYEFGFVGFHDSENQVWYLASYEE